MKLFTYIMIAATILFGVLVFQVKNNPQSNNIPAEKKSSITVHKTLTCGCCANFAAYMRREGYDVEVVNYNTNDELAVKKRELGIPNELDSCHTTVFDQEKYFVEGHIPVEATEKMLAEKPEIKGIGMPGMPSASPGMPGSKTQPFNISQVSLDETVTPYITL